MNPWGIAVGIVLGVAVASAVARAVRNRRTPPPPDTPEERADLDQQAKSAP